MKASAPYHFCKNYLERLHQSILDTLKTLDPSAKPNHTRWSYRHQGGGLGVILEGGQVIERAGIHFSAIEGKQLPAQALPDGDSAHASSSPFRATGVSCIVHPKNPHAPTSHMNVRYFEQGEESLKWWFGGGFDLTPTIGYENDAQSWHRAALEACGSDSRYQSWKKQCDQYFFLPHRGECRGIGGLFFDHYHQPDFDTCQRVWKRVGNAYAPAYRTILLRRMHTPFNQEERAFQLLRRGRYVEFNLLYDRGTRFGLEAGGNVATILSSMPSAAHWSSELEQHPRNLDLKENYLQPRSWLD